MNQKKNEETVIIEITKKQSDFLLCYSFREIATIVLF